MRWAKTGLLIQIALLLVSCHRPPPQPPLPTCQRAIDYQGREYIVKGPDINLTKTISTKSGSFEYRLQNIQSANATAQLLDIQQYNLCVFWIRSPSSEERQLYAKLQAEALQALVNLAMKISATPNQSETGRAISEAARQSAEINKQAPIPRSPEAPPPPAQGAEPPAQGAEQPRSSPPPTPAPVQPTPIEPAPPPSAPSR